MTSDLMDGVAKLSCGSSRQESRPVPLAAYAAVDTCREFGRTACLSITLTPTVNNEAVSRLAKQKQKRCHGRIAYHHQTSSASSRDRDEIGEQRETKRVEYCSIAEASVKLSQNGWVMNIGNCSLQRIVSLGRLDELCLLFSQG